MSQYDIIAEVALNIIAQLGGNKFRAMTGAKDFLSFKNGLGFKLPTRFAKSGINYVKIILTPDDLYTITFIKYRGIKATTVCECEGVFAEDLQRVFTEKTGLDTHL